MERSAHEGRARSPATPGSMASPPASPPIRRKPLPSVDVQSMENAYASTRTYSNPRYGTVPVHERSLPTSPLVSPDNNHHGDRSARREPSAPRPYHNEKPQGRRRRCFRSDGWWLPEVLSFLVSVAALVTIVVLLAAYRDKPLPNWPALVSINSLVAIFTSIMKAALLYPIAQGIGELKWMWFARPRPLNDMERFDSASRGPWGALLLLLRNPTNALTSLAAIICILALAIDPFAQQVLRYYTCLVPVDGAGASVPRTNFYMATGQHIAAGLQALDGPMTIALYGGLIDPPTNASVNIPFTCPSGNCTIAGNDEGVYYSLAMCYELADTTHLVKTSAGDPDANVPSSVYSLPSGANATAEGGQLLGTGAVDSSLGEGDVMNRFGFAFDVVMLLQDCAGQEGGTPDPSSSDECPYVPFAISAHLRPCIQAYRGTNVTNFVLSEASSHSTMLVPFYTNGVAYYALAGNYPSFPGQDCTPSKSSQGVKTAMALVQDDGAHVYIDPSITIKPNASMVYYDPGCVFMYSEGAADGLHGMVETFFGGVGNQQHMLIAPVTGLSQPDGEVWLKRLYNNGTADLDSVKGYMQGFADAISVVVRKNGAPDHSSPATGATFGAATCIAVDWAWLALPALLLAATLAFLGATALRAHLARRQEDPVRKLWKSSALPLLWCGLADEVRRQYQPFDGVKDMQDNGDELLVCLRRDAAGPMHTEKNPSSAGRWLLAEGSHDT